MRLLSLLFTVVVSVVAFAQVPTITNISTINANPGASITITGTGFSTTTTSNQVRFGSTLAVVSSATSTSLTVTVPNGATHDFIYVNVGGLTAVSSKKFFPSNSSLSGTFSSSSLGTPVILNSTSYFSTASISTIRIKDIDNDGNPDIIKPSSYPGSGHPVIASYKNVSNSGALTTASFNTGVNNAITASASDFNSMACVDFNNDGYIDAAFGDMYMGNGRAVSNASPTVFGFTSQVNTPAMGWVNSADFNNDGKLDLAFINFDPTIKVALNSTTSSTISFSSAVTIVPNTLSVSGSVFNGIHDYADFNNDGKIDVVFGDASNLYFLKNNYSTGTFNSSSFSSTGTFSLSNITYTDINCGDFDKDGDLDVALLQNNGTIQIYTNNSSGATISFSAGSSFSLPSGAGTGIVKYFNLGDINGDGKLDIIVPSKDGSNTGNISFFLNNTTSNISFTSTVYINNMPTSYQIADVELADLNGDGKIDIAGTSGGHSVFVIQNNYGPTPPSISSQPTLSTTSICAGTSSGSLSITATGATSYQWQISSNAGSTWADISGMTGSTFPGMTMNSAGSYIFRCNAINSAGTTNSSATGTLTVNAAPTLTTNLTTTVSQNCYNPSSTTALTVATSAGSPSYQWQVSTNNSTFTNVVSANGSGGTTASFIPSHADILYGNTKYYRCVVTSSGCSTTSNSTPFSIYASLTSVTIPSTANENYCINGTPNNLVMQYTGDNNLVYQWSWGSTSTGPWNNISGATATTYTPPTNAANTRYYRCNVAGTCSNTAKVSGAITVTDTYTWTGATSTNPTVAGNWNPAAVPCSGANEVIPSGLTNYPVYTNLTIDAGTTLTVNTGGRLTVTGTLTNNGTMTIESGATFVQGTSLAGSGTYNVKQFVTGAGGSTPSGRFWYMGLPINNLSRQTAFGAASASNRLWSWSESAQAWSSQITDATALSPTTGYVFRTGADVTLTFTGTSLYSADASITGLTNTTGSFDGCHLMSNPYTAYLDWDQIAAAAGTTNLSSTVTVRSYNTSNSQMVYDTYNATGSVAVQNSSYAVSKYIAPMQSFWVVVNPSTTGTLSMTKAMLTHQPTAPGLKDLTSFPAFARLNLVDGSFTDQVVVYTDAEANAELEAFDSKKFFLPNVAQVYCKVGNDKLVINALKKGKAQTSAPLTVELPSTKVYKFEMAESFVDNGLVILEDRQEGIFQDMGINPTYEFFGNSGVIADRFVLHFQLPNGASNEGQAGVEDLTSSQIAVISNQNGSILVSLSADLTATGEVQVLDAAGRLIQTTAIKGQDTKLQITEGTGVYFVRVSTPMKSETKKVLVY